MSAVFQLFGLGREGGLIEAKLSDQASNLTDGQAVLSSERAQLTFAHQGNQHLVWRPSVSVLSPNNGT